MSTALTHCNGCCGAEACHSLQVGGGRESPPGHALERTPLGSMACLHAAAGCKDGLHVRVPVVAAVPATTPAVATGLAQVLAAAQSMQALQAHVAPSRHPCVHPCWMAGPVPCMQLLRAIRGLHHHQLQQAPQAKPPLDLYSHTARQGPTNTPEGHSHQGTPQALQLPGSSPRAAALLPMASPHKHQRGLLQHHLLLLLLPLS